MSWHLLQKSSSESSVSFQKRSQQNCLSILKFCSHRLNTHTLIYTHAHNTYYTYTTHKHTPPNGCLTHSLRGQRSACPACFTAENLEPGSICSPSKARRPQQYCTLPLFK